MKEKISMTLRTFSCKVKRGWHNFANKVKDLIANRPEVVVAILGAIGMFFKSFFRWRTTKNLKDMQDKRVYDPRRGHYVYTKRKLSGREYEEFDRRYRNREDASEILRSMGLLK